METALSPGFRWSSAPPTMRLPRCSKNVLRYLQGYCSERVAAARTCHYIRGGRQDHLSTAIFFGAGASAAEGAPIQNALFSDYFAAANSGSVSHSMDRELATFFFEMFGVDVDNQQALTTAVFPTFEEALGILDLAERRKESLKDFDLENMASNSNRIRFIRQYLVMLMAKVLHDKLEHSGSKHRRLVSKLHEAERVRDTVFITANYDILIDNALTNLYSEGSAVGLWYRLHEFRRRGRLETAEQTGSQAVQDPRLVELAVLSNV